MPSVFSDFKLQARADTSFKADFFKIQDNIDRLSRPLPCLDSTSVELGPSVLAMFHRKVAPVFSLELIKIFLGLMIYYVLGLIGSYLFTVAIAIGIKSFLQPSEIPDDWLFEKCVFWRAASGSHHRSPNCHGPCSIHPAGSPSILGTPLYLGVTGRRSGWLKLRKATETRTGSSSTSQTP
ncbi:hypothetical protein C8J56DRAFT_1028885 [Mycena floridula]|nr:hypothetical protein C8J56DRAFT_1028885 [Mycena floridula]